MNEIKLVGPEIKGRAGETVRLEAEFDHVTNACVHERYRVKKDSQDVNELLIDKEIKLI